MYSAIHPFTVNYEGHCDIVCAQWDYRNGHFDDGPWSIGISMDMKPFPLLKTIRSNSRPGFCLKHPKLVIQNGVVGIVFNDIIYRKEWAYNGGDKSCFCK